MTRDTSRPRASRTSGNDGTRAPEPSMRRGRPDRRQAAPDHPEQGQRSQGARRADGKRAGSGPSLGTGPSGTSTPPNRSARLASWRPNTDMGDINEGRVHRPTPRSPASREGGERARARGVRTDTFGGSALGSHRRGTRPSSEDVRRHDGQARARDAGARADRRQQAMRGGNPRQRQRNAAPDGQGRIGAPNNRQRPMSPNATMRGTRDSRAGAGPRNLRVPGRRADRQLPRDAARRMLTPMRIAKALLCGAGIALVGTIAFASPAGMTPEYEQTLFDMPLLDGTRLMVSTPRSQWHQGEMPYLFQTDPLWSEKPYAGDTVRANGCGPTCLTMVYIYLTGDTSIDPGQMCAIADAGNYAPTGATEWRFMTQGAASLGITGRAISVAESTVTAALEAGQPVICSMRPGDFTSIGHYIVLESVDERGMVSVHDPNSSLRSAQAWRLDWVLSQATNCWTFTA